MESSLISTFALRMLLALGSLLRRSDSKKKLLHSAEVHKVFINKMQGQLADYALVARTKHEALRKPLENPSDINKVKSCCDDLEQFLEHGHAKACQETFLSLDQYFSLRHKSNLHKPRFCIKLVRENAVFTFLRGFDHPKEPQLVTNPIPLNTGFQSIKDSAKSFLCNDIPSEAKVSRYVNPRLRPESVAQYKHPSKWSFKSIFPSNQLNPDLAWINCWTNHDGTNTPRQSAEQCYKSTLIVPMSLRYEQVSLEFWNEFKRHFDTANPFHIGSFGFLCIDCHERHYFDQELDEKFGSVCADILSLFSIATYLYTSLSPPYREAQKKLQATKPQGDFQ